MRFVICVNKNTSSHALAFFMFIQQIHRRGWWSSWFWTKLLLLGSLSVSRWKSSTSTELPRWWRYISTPRLKSTTTAPWIPSGKHTVPYNWHPMKVNSLLTHLQTQSFTSVGLLRFKYLNIWLFLPVFLQPRLFISRFSQSSMKTLWETTW